MLNRLKASLPSRMLTSLLTGLLAAITVGNTQLPAETPSVTLLFPPVVQAGQSSTITVSGDQLGTITQLLSAHGELETESVDKHRVTVRAAAGSEPGRLDVWTMTSNGLANPRSLLVVTHPVLVISETPDPEASLVPVPGTVAAKLDRHADRDAFAFDGKTGQWIHITCRSQSLDGNVAPILSVHAPDSTELAHSQPHHSEPTITLQLPADGRYQVHVVDRRFKHSLLSIYTLTVQAGPRLVNTHPTAVSNHSLQLLVSGHALPGATRNAPNGRTTLPLDIPAPRPTPTWPDRRPVGVLQDGFRTRLPDTIGRPWVTLSEERVLTETPDQNNSPASAQHVNLPARVCGRFETRADIDWYTVDLKKDQTLEIACWGERLGQAMELETIVHDDAGKTLATIGTLATPKKLGIEFPFSTSDPHGHFQAKADGRYRIVVRDLYAGSLFGPDRAYQMVLASPQPRFHAYSVVGDGKTHAGLTLAANGSAKLQIVVIRTGGGKSEVTVAIEGLPDGVTAESVKLPADTAIATLTLNATARAKPALLPIRVLATTADDSAARDVLPVVHLPGTTPARRVADALILAVTPATEPADKKGDKKGGKKSDTTNRTRTAR